jgi:hypothetical protein
MDRGRSWRASRPATWAAAPVGEAAGADGVRNSAKAGADAVRALDPWFGAVGAAELVTRMA